MSRAVIHPAALSGTLAAPPSKSAAHRALICAALADGKSRVYPLAGSADMAATAQCLCAMGAQIAREGDAAFVEGGRCAAGAEVTLDCAESGSTLRFLLPVAAAYGLRATFVGRGRLPERPLGALADQMKAHGVSFSAGAMPFTIGGRLSPGRYELPGDVSSQFVTGLLFALPLLDGESEIVLTSPLQSAGYVEMTLRALQESGVAVTPTENGWRVPGNQRFRAFDRTVEGDWSNAAFWLCAAAIGGTVRITGLSNDSAQGDRAVYEILERFGADITRDAHAVCCEAAPLRAQRIDAGQIPDLVPVLAVTAAFAEGDTEIYNAARLRIKESDRLASTAALLRALGGSAEEYPDRLVVHGGGLRGGDAQGANDHRIVMAAAVAALGCREKVCVTDAHAINKSYPDFFDELNKLGGRCNVDMG